MILKIKNTSKAAFKDQIVRKQNQFNRFKRRCKVSVNPVEKRFLKTEAVQIVKDLKQFSKQWKNCGFGSSLWITRGFNTTGFSTTAARKSTRKGIRKNSRKTTRKYGSKTTARKRYGNRSYARRTNKVGSSIRRTRKGGTTRRTSKMRRSYVAW